MVIPTCPVCTSRKWRKARGTGELICSEGHVLQGYINETNEVTEFGAHTVHRRHIRVGRRRKGPREQENPDIYHGPRARYLYYQCRQLILRHQLDSLVSEWELPAEAKNICRTMWLLALEILPQAPPPEPWIYAQTEQDQQEEEEEKEKQPVETLDIPKEEQGQSSDTDGADDEAGNESQIEHELEELMREASTTESDSGSKKGDAAQGRKAYGRDTRHNLYNSAAMNISILVLTCWWLRIPVMYSDFINLINSYRIPYLNVVSLIPDNMQKHLSTAVRQELTPPHAPTVAGLNLITRRIARRLHANLGVDIPELNVAPILWRGVRAFQGPPTLYAMAKKLMERLEIPLTIHPSLAPRPSSGLQQQSGDWAPTEVSIACIMIIVLKLVYGFEENIRFVPQEEDPAACFPSFADYMISLRRGREEDSVSFSRLLSRHSERTAETLSNEELDKYLNVAERALGSHPMGNTKPISEWKWRSLPGGYMLIERSIQTVDVNLRRNTEYRASFEYSNSWDRLIIWSPTDPLGVLPADYALLIDTASAWSGVEHSNINHLVAAMERRLHRSIAKERDEENTSSDSNGEYIDTDDVDLADSEEEKSFKGLKEEDADDADVEMSDQPTTFKFGSQKWRERVHNKLSQKRHPKGAYKEETASPELDESDMEEEDSKDNLAL
ncbi:hypothetical protein BDV93DRAFT_572689 [Ceratobasidium sp. AG-I]|nr:hypothetical protein BDV93DRAFT_572689 [Ceratobasidium sp. AG-I]